MLLKRYRSAQTFGYICLCTQRIMLIQRDYPTPPIMVDPSQYEIVAEWCFPTRNAHASKHLET